MGLSSNLEFNWYYSFIGNSNQPLQHFDDGFDLGWNVLLYRGHIALLLIWRMFVTDPASKLSVTRRPGLRRAPSRVTFMYNALASHVLLKAQQKFLAARWIVGKLFTGQRRIEEFIIARQRLYFWRC